MDDTNNTSITTYATYEDYVRAQKGYGFAVTLSREEWTRLWSPETDPKRRTHDTTA